MISRQNLDIDPKLKKNMTNPDAIEEGIADLPIFKGRVESIRGRILISLIYKVLESGGNDLKVFSGLEGDHGIELSAKELITNFKLSSKDSAIEIFEKIHDFVVFAQERAPNSKERNFLASVLHALNALLERVHIKGIKVLCPNLTYGKVCKCCLEEFDKLLRSTLEAEYISPRLFKSRDEERVTRYLWIFESTDLINEILGERIFHFNMKLGEVTYNEDEFSKHEHLIFHPESKMDWRYFLTRSDISVVQSILRALSDKAKSMMLAGKEGTALIYDELSSNSKAHHLGYDVPVLYPSLLQLSEEFDIARVKDILQALGQETKIKPLHVASQIGDIGGIKKMIRSNPAKKHALLEEDDEGMDALEYLTFAPNLKCAVRLLKLLRKS